MQHSNFEPSKKSTKKTKVIPLKVQSKNAALEYLFLSLEKLNDTLDHHLKEEENSNTTSDE